MPRRVGDGPQLGIDGSGVIGPCLTPRLADPFRKCHTLTPGSALNIDVLFLIQKNLESFRHYRSLIDSYTMSQTPSERGVARQPHGAW